MLVLAAMLKAVACTTVLVVALAIVSFGLVQDLHEKLQFADAAYPVVKYNYDDDDDGELQTYGSVHQSTSTCVLVAVGQCWR